MKKGFGVYVFAWILVFLLFATIVLALPSLPGIEKYSTSFWIGYSFTLLAFIAQFVCSIFAFSAASQKRAFYNISLIKSSYVGLIVTVVLGFICMFVPFIPYWLCLILCAIVFVCNVLAVVKAGAMAEVLETVDKDVKVKTAFIKLLTADVSTLVVMAKSEGVKNECNRLYEAVRYSDPMSCEELEPVEGKINLQLTPLTEAIEADDEELVKAIVDNMIVLLTNRNQKCKVLK